jgi:FtsH-binding integral membrane protein
LIDARHFPTEAEKMTTKSAELLHRYFYLAMSLVIAAIVIYGFSHTVNENLIHPAYPRPFVLYFHAAIFTGWVVLLITQSALIRTRNLRLHRKLGLCALALAIALPMRSVTRFLLHPGAACASCR